MKLKCPKCGESQLLHSYLKVNHACDECGQDPTHSRADDGPAYLTILVVCHIAGFVLHWVYANFSPEPLFVALGIGMSTIVLALFLLPRMKGPIIGVQWAKRMHGFGQS